MPRSHEYAADLSWKGNLGGGTSTYDGYSREYAVEIAGKPALRGSADPMFRGDPAIHNPEDMFLAAISSCHMLSYLALCAREGVNVVAYEDRVNGTLVFAGTGGGRFEKVTLHPVVTITDGTVSDRAMALHEKAHELCFIAASCSVPIHHEPTIRVEGTE